MTARKALRLAIDDALELGLFVPCIGRDEWISNDPTERATAARLCDGCPCLDECQAVADELTGYARLNVWAGVDITPQTTRRTTPKENTPHGTAS